MVGLASAFLYFGYTSIIVFAFFLLTGTVNTSIYRALNPCL
jgi:hypothetical protein